jgi:hypothetical protein
MEEGLVHEGVTLETLGDAAKAVEPGKEPLHHPAIAGEFPVGVGTVLEFSVIGRSPQGNAVADTAPNQREPKGLAVVAAICGQATGTIARSASPSGHFDLGQGQRRSRNVGHVACCEMTG